MTRTNIIFWLLLVFTFALISESNCNQITRKSKREAVVENNKPTRRTEIISAQPIAIKPPGPDIHQAILAYHEIDFTTKEYGPTPCKDGEANCPIIKEPSPCVPLVYCAAFYYEVLQNNSFCKVDSNAYLARCRIPRENDEPPTAAAGAPEAPSEDTSRFDFPPAAAANAISNALTTLEGQGTIEMELLRNDLVVNNPDTPEFGHLQFFQASPEAANISKIALAQEIAASSLMSSPETAASADSPIADAPVDEQPIQCPLPPEDCESDNLYRRYDGSCNNLMNPTWGKSLTAFQRFAGVTYSDGISVPRKSASGNDLPSPRVISTQIAKDMDKPSPTYTLSVMQWGQFIDHDLTQAPITRIDGMTGILCCDRDGLPLPQNLTHRECLPIEIPEDDYFYSTFGRRCMTFVRSLPAPNIECRLGFRNQMNQLSQILDGSQIYGSSEDVANLLREFKDGLLKVQAEDLLPDNPSSAKFDFLAGDSRVNEQPHLMVIQTIWLRQHNRVARELLTLNPSWDDEKIYQESRRIIIAQVQHIIYNEWLPVVLGAATTENSNLLPKRSGFSNRYNENVNPTILNEFASAAFRFGHTLIEGTLKRFGQNYENVDTFELSDNFGLAQILTGDQSFDRILRGFFKQPMQQFDNCVADDVSNKLFKTPAAPFGLDLVSLNIQRGRDHGIGTYNDILSACNLPRVTDFKQLESNLREGVASLFSNVYESVDDIDTFIAGISEKPKQDGGILGPIFNCVVKEQFARLKFGDRFFYENGGMPTSFTEAQLNEIRKTSWARIICDNSQTVTRIQPLAFRLTDTYNAKISCSSEVIPTTNLSSWRDSEEYP